MKRLVIKHGEQILRYELKDEPVVVGREIGCDLTFDDPSLSRRHGSFEATPAGVRFKDLESRNGSWVNFKKTKEAELSPGDAVRIGSLLITYQYEEPEPPPKPDEDPADDTATVIVSTKAAPPSPKPPEKTPPSEPPQEGPVAPASPPPEPAPAKSAVQDKTVLLDRKAASPPAPAATSRQGPPELPKTRALRREAHVEKKTPSDTARLPQESAPPRLPPQSAAPTAPPGALPMAPAVEDEEAPGSAWSWTARQAAVLLGATLTIYVVLALPLVRTLGNALREESLRRGRVLLDLLAATNASAMAEGRSRDLDIDPVIREERVKEALLLSLDGKLLAPSSRVGETLGRIEGIQPDVEAVRTFYLGRRGNGDYVMVEPVLDRGLRVGLAVVVYEVATTSGSWAVAVLFLGFLVLLLCVVVALLLAKRFTLAPLQALQDDVEAVVKGDAARLPLTQGFAELSEIARSVNRLIERSVPATAASARPAAAAHPNLDLPPRVTAPIPPTPAPPPRSSTSDKKASPEPERAPAPEAPSASPGDGARFWADGNFIVVRAEAEAARLMGAEPEALEGRHVIEAIKDQRLLGVVLDALNALDNLDKLDRLDPNRLDNDTPAAMVADLGDGSLSVSASREGEWVVVRLKRTQ